jgi:FtsZ-binding cell division protein ZapB
MLGLSTIKLVIIGVAAALLIGLGIKAYHDIKESGRQEVRDEVAKEHAAEKARTDKLKEESDYAWQEKLAALQTRIDSTLVAPGPAIRLCKPAPQVRLSDPASVPNETAAEPGPAMQAGDDLRRPLILYGGDCEKTRGQLAELQVWLHGVSQ